MKDSDISNRISMLRFLLIFGVVVVHTPPIFDVDESNGTLWAYITSFLQNGVFRAGVPVLTMVSGYLLFTAGSDLKYPALLKKKASTLLVPFLVFNLGHIAAQLLVYLATGHWVGENLFSQDFSAWMNSMFSLKGVPENIPLHFLRELIVLAILSPIFGLFIRKAPLVGFALVCLFFLTNTDGYLVNRSDMAVEFYAGGLAAVYKWNLKALDKFAYPALLVFCAACAAVTIFEIDDITWLRLMAPLLVWTAASRLVDTPLGKWLTYLSKYSFFVFVAHSALMRISWIVFQKLLPMVPVPLFTVIAPFAVTFVCIALYKLLNLVMPAQLDWALGSRGEKAQRSARGATSAESLKNT